MTRDEAINCLDGMVWGELSSGNRKHSSKMIDAFVALGMLKLDDVPPAERFKNFLERHPIGCDLERDELDDLVEELERAGLQIVEKQP